MRIIGRRLILSRLGRGYPAAVLVQEALRDGEEESISVMITSIVSAALFMVGLGVLLAAVLAAANRKLHVHEDPRIDDVEDMLPHANCGA